MKRSNKIISIFRQRLSKMSITTGVLLIIMFVFGIFIIVEPGTSTNSILSQFDKVKENYEVYYVSGGSLFANSPESTNKRNVVSLENESIIDYFVIKFNNSIILASKNAMYKADEEGKRVKIIEFPLGFTFRKWQLSPNNNLITVIINKEVTVDGKWEEQQIGYLLNIANNDSIEIFSNSATKQKEQLNYLLWHADNQRVFLIKTRVYDSNNVREEYFNYDIYTRKEKFLGDQDALKKPYNENSFAKEDIWKTQIPNPLPARLIAYSKDGHEARLEEGFLLVNGQKVIPVCQYNQAYNHHNCSNLQWTPDSERLFIEGFNNSEIRVIEMKSKKYATYDNGYNVKIYSVL